MAEESKTDLHRQHPDQKPKKGSNQRFYRDINTEVTLCSLFKHSKFDSKARKQKQAYNSDGIGQLEPVLSQKRFSIPTPICIHWCPSCFWTIEEEQPLWSSFICWTVNTSSLWGTNILILINIVIVSSIHSGKSAEVCTPCSHDHARKV